MPNMQERLNAAVDRAEIDTELLHEVVNGDITTTGEVESGSVPTVAKAINDIRVVVNENANILHEFTHGDENTVIITENGPVPSAAKTVKDIREYIQNGTDDLVGQAKEAAQQAKNWAIKTDGTVEKLDYSAKYYAETAEKIASDMDKKSDTLAGYGILDGVAYEQILDDKIIIKILHPESLTFTVIG